MIIIDIESYILYFHNMKTQFNIENEIMGKLRVIITDTNTHPIIRSEQISHLHGYYTGYCMAMDWPINKNFTSVFGEQGFKNEISIH